ncbi:MAG: AsnC family transcriptional regulator [Gammaproteobacteria bacterium]|jgi:Lrp/AsnC family transcriptional regulator|nr:AsnC family transcriptional regulator [Gammaproteobacteria bacterium]|tara:strand:+ start:100 stop:600 length:501 start_codon:yes stop_codon:yes gene_type:complete
MARKITSKPKPRPAELDRLDLDILEVLQADAKATIAEISKRVGLSQTPCWKRLKHLHEAGVITEQVSIINPRAVGLDVTAFVTLSVKLNSDDEEASFGDAIRNIEEVMECYSLAGEKDFMLKVVASSLQSFKHLLRNTLSQLPGVQSIESTLALTKVKCTTHLPLD